MPEEKLEMPEEFSGIVKEAGAALKEALQKHAEQGVYYAVTIFRQQEGDVFEAAMFANSPDVGVTIQAVVSAVTAFQQTMVVPEGILEKGGD